MADIEQAKWLWRRLPRKCREKVFRGNFLLFLYTVRDITIDVDILDVNALDCSGVDTFLHSLRNYRKRDNVDINYADVIQVLHDVESIEGLKDIDPESIPEIINAVYDIVFFNDTAKYDNVANLRMRKLNYVIEHLL